MKSPLRRPTMLVTAAALACWTLAGCAAPGLRTGPVGRPTPCTPGVCTIQVFVDNCQQAGGIRLDKPFVETDRAVNLRWEIVTPGFVFAADGIRLDPPDPQFQQQHSPHPNEFRLHNSKASNGDFYYFVNVQGCRQMDPWIRNR